MTSSGGGVLEAKEAAPPRRGRLFVVSGPSGVGKDTVIQHFLPSVDRVVLSISATTRAPRPGESQGNPYFFMDTREFEVLVDQNALLEYAKVSGNYYGTPRLQVEEQTALGNDVLLKIDVQGGTNIRTHIPDAVLIFLMPPSVAELERRLRSRSTETELQIRDRLLTARSELQYISSYDYALVNDDIARAADRLRAIFLAERCRVHPERHAERPISSSWTAPHV